MQRLNKVLKTTQFKVTLRNHISRRGNAVRKSTTNPNLFFQKAVTLKVESQAIKIKLIIMNVLSNIRTYGIKLIDKAVTQTGKTGKVYIFLD